MPSFETIEHVLPCQHIREYFHATVSGADEELQLHVKQYIPNDQQPKGTARHGITIIAAHSNGFFKELYEVLWEDLLQRLRKSDVKVNSIWMADVAHQGSSGVLNEHKLGSEPNWFDHSRDLLHMVNHFRAQISRPIIGIGHSMGAAQIVHLSTIHPRLFHSVVLLDPVMHIAPLSGNPPMAKIATFRKEVWPSRNEAAKSVIRSRFYKTWDPRVRDQLIQYGFREGPTTAVPNIDSKAVTLITSKHQEAFTNARANYDGLGIDREIGAEERTTHPDIHGADPSKAPFYRPEIRLAYSMLESLRPACLYIMGKKSQFLAEPGLEAKLHWIGTGVGGSGGMKSGRVKFEKVNGAHFFPFESIDETAEVIGDWIKKEAARSEKEEQVMLDRWEGKKGRQRQVVDEKWIQNVKNWKGKKVRTKL